MYTIEQVEDAILSALIGAAGLNICKTIDTYHGEIDALTAQVGQLTVLLPAVYILFAGSTYIESANRSFDEEQVFTIVIIAKDLRGKDKLRAAIYPLIEIIKNTLINNNLNMNIEPLHPVRIEATMITKLFSVYSFDIKTSFDFN